MRHLAMALYSAILRNLHALKLGGFTIYKHGEQEGEELHGLHIQQSPRINVSVIPARCFLIRLLLDVTRIFEFFFDITNFFCHSFIKTHLFVYFSNMLSHTYSIFHN